MAIRAIISDVESEAVTVFLILSHDGNGWFLLLLQGHISGYRTRRVCIDHKILCQLTKVSFGLSQNPVDSMDDRKMILTASNARGLDVYIVAIKIPSQKDQIDAACGAGIDLTGDPAAIKRNALHMDVPRIDPFLESYIHPLCLQVSGKAQIGIRIECVIIRVIILGDKGINPFFKAAYGIGAIRTVGVYPAGIRDDLGARSKISCGFIVKVEPDR